MADPAELLAMMTPHGPRPGHVPGGIPALTALDVAGAMGMARLRPEWSALLLVKYCGDEGPIHSLWAYWFRRIMAERRLAEWETEPGQCERLSLATLDEHLRANTCRACEGTGIMLDGAVKACAACDGTGRKYPGERHLAAALRVTRHQYRAHWTGRVSWCRGELMSWERRALAAIRGSM